MPSPTPSTDDELTTPSPPEMTSLPTTAAQADKPEQTVDGADGPLRVRGGCGCCSWICGCITGILCCECCVRPVLPSLAPLPPDDTDTPSLAPSGPAKQC